MSVSFDCIKLFHEKSHAEQFMRGDLRFTRVKTYIDIECKAEGVQDEYEGMVKLKHPCIPMIDVGRIERLVTGNPDIPSRFEQISEPISKLSFKGCDQSFVLCCTDIYEVQEDKDSFGGSLEDLRFTDEYLDFAKGYKHAVFFNSLEVSEKLAVYAQDNDLVFHNHMVSYSDEGSSPDEPGNLLALKCIYVKPKKFDYEHEYRYALMLSPQRIEAGNTIVADKDIDHFYADIGAIEALDIPIEIDSMIEGDLDDS